MNEFEDSKVKEIELLHAKAKQGDARSQYLLGSTYEYGKWHEENMEKAVYWYRQAAEQGDASAQVSLGRCYFLGQGLEENREVGISWFRQAAEKGNIAGQIFLAFCYKNGDGVGKNAKSAVHWFRQAAEQGNADAQVNLSSCYKNGEGVKRNLKKAVFWCRKAAEQEDKVAQFNLGVMYENGEGVEKDIAQAMEWYRKAARQGHESAQYALGLQIEGSGFGSRPAKFKKGEKIKIFDSLSQLEEDFLDFPPKPLKCVEIKGEFELRRDSKIHFYFFIFRKFVRDMLSAASGRSGYNERDAFEDSLVKEFDGYFNSGSSQKIFLKLKRRAFAFLSILFFPIIALRLIRKGKFKKSLALFSVFASTYKGRGVIYLSDNIFQEDAVEYASVLSHEHIHYLQYLNFCNGGDSVLEKDTIRSPDLLLDSSVVSQDCGRIVNYLFSEKEMEARLHELVLSYYRKNRSLPTTLKDFVLMVFNSEIGRVATLVHCEKGSAEYLWSSRSLNQGNVFSIRGRVFYSDMAEMSKSIKNMNMRIRFVKEVLPVLYTRLLSYYGDKEASDRFGALVSRPNLYDQLYL